jgi:hypothetical protein
MKGEIVSESAVRFVRDFVALYGVNLPISQQAGE